MPCPRRNHITLPGGGPLSLPRRRRQASRDDHCAAGVALASTLLIVAPGPDSLLVLRNTLRNGRRAGWVTASGTLSGLLLWAVAAAPGLSTLLRGQPSRL